MSEREQFIENLRQFAQFLESHPNVPIPVNYGGVKFSATVETVADLRKAFHISGPWDKELMGELAYYRKSFGPQPANRYERGSHVTYQLSLPREEVCAKRVVGQEWVPPSPAYAPTPGHYRDIVEWDCM